MTEPPNTEALLATIVRFAGRAVGVDGDLDVLEAASYLKAELERLQRNVDDLRPGYFIQVVNAAEAELERVRAERDAYAKRMPEVIETHNHWKSRAVEAEALLNRAEEALRFIEDATAGRSGIAGIADIARAALAEIEEPE